MWKKSLISLVGAFSIILVLSSCGASSSGNFYTSAESFVTSVPDDDICNNIDKLAALKSLASGAGEQALLEQLDAEELIIKALLKNTDLDQVVANTKVLEKKYNNEKDLFTNDVKLSEMISSSVGDCMADQTRWASLVEVVSNLVNKHVDLVLALDANNSLEAALGTDYNKTRACVNDVSSYINRDLEPYIRNASMDVTYNEATDAEQGVVATRFPHCIDGFTDNIIPSSASGTNPAPYSISATVSSGSGSVYPQSAILASGSSQQITITPYAGNIIASVTVDGTPLTTDELKTLEDNDNVYTFSHVTSNHSLYAAFEQVMYTVTTVIVGTGSINPSFPTGQSMPSGSGTWLTMTTSSPYTLGDLTIDGESKISSVTRTSQYQWDYYLTVSGAHTITATFR